MDEVVLVTGSETLTGRKLIEKLLGNGAKVVAPVVGRESDINETGTPNLTVLTWNRASWFSTKTVARETLRLYGCIDAAFLLHHAMTQNGPFIEAGSGDVESILENSVKGSVALCRELLPVLETSAGFLGMIKPHRHSGSSAPLESLASSAFNGFSEALVKEAGPSVWACGFAGASPDADGFASAILAQWKAKPAKLRGRWYRFAEGRRPFGGSTIVDSPE